LEVVERNHFLLWDHNLIHEPSRSNDLLSIVDYNDVRLQNCFMINDFFTVS